MKIIKSFLFITASLCVTTLVHAQDIKAEIAKPIESTVPAPGSRPAANTDLIPQPKMIEFKKSENAVQETPSPYTKVKNDTNPVASLSAENAKILAGTAERPKQTAPVAASDAPNLKPQTLLAPAPVVLKPGDH